MPSRHFSEKTFFVEALGDTYSGVSLPRLFVIALLLALLPVLDLATGIGVTDKLRVIFIFAILGLGLNIVIGFAGLLHLGVGGFMAIGAFSYSILTCDIYPFQLGFWIGIAMTIMVCLVAGFLLGLPTIRLKGDYLAIVTLGFGEIVQDTLRNLEVITRGTQGINPLPPPSFFGYVFESSSPIPWYYLLLAFLVAALFISSNLERSRLGRAFLSVREDELAASCMGVDATRVKLLAFALGAAFCGLAGGLWANHLGSSGEPGNYDFQISVTVLCIVIVGGLGSVPGVLVGALVMIGFNSIVLSSVSEWLTSNGYASTTNVLASPNNWKYLIFGLALVLMMRFRPEGLIPSSHIKEELHHRD